MFPYYNKNETFFNQIRIVRGRYMQEIVMKLWFLLSHRNFLILLFIINFLGTLYGYYWYIPQLEVTDPVFMLFVPDSPTASLFFCFAILAWLLGKNYKLMEALAVVTLVKYGVWAVVLNIITIFYNGEFSSDGLMLIVSHGLMAVQAFLYLPKYKFTTIHVVIAAVWTLHNDVIDYVFGQFPTYHFIKDYPMYIGYFTFWLSIACIFIAYKASERERFVALS